MYFYDSKFLDTKKGKNIIEYSIMKSFPMEKFIR